MAVETFGNNFATTVGVGGITNVATSLPVAAAATGNIATGQFRILVESEIMTVTAGNGTTTWTVTRGDEGTTAVAHLAGAPVTHLITAASLVRVVEGRAIVASPDASYNLSAASGLWLPQSAGAAPANTGQIAHDTTQRATNVRDAVFGVGSISRVLKCAFSVAGGDSLAAATITTTETVYATNLVLPANYLIANKCLRVTGTFIVTTSSTPATQRFKLRVGTVILFDSGVFTPNASLTGSGYTFVCYVMGEAAAGATANTSTSLVQAYIGGTFIKGNSQAQPVVVATNASQTLQWSLQYGASTAGNTVALRHLIVEELN